MKINIFKDTIELKEAKRFKSLLLFVLEKFPDVNLRMAYFIAENKTNEISYYETNYKGEIK